MAEVLLGEADHGSVIEVLPGTRVLLRLPENPSTGYRWELEPFEPHVIELQADTYQAPPTLAPGAGGVRVFAFLARSGGRTVLLRLRLRRAWEPRGYAVKTFEVTLQVQSP